MTEAQTIILNRLNSHISNPSKAFEFGPGYYNKRKAGDIIQLMKNGASAKILYREEQRKKKKS